MGYDIRFLCHRYILVSELFKKESSLVMGSVRDQTMSNIALSLFASQVNCSLIPSDQNLNVSYEKGLWFSPGFWCHTESTSRALLSTGRATLW